MFLILMRCLKCNSAQYTGDQYCVCTFSTTWIVPWTADTFRLWSSNTGNPERNRILNSISVCADGHSFYYNECFHLYDTELDRMGSQLRKSINKRTSEKTLPVAWIVCIIMQAITYIMFG